MSRLVLVAAVALVDAAERVLLARRPAGKAMAGLWEFPGGKIEADETLDLAALCFASHGYPDFHLLMPLYLCRRWQGQPTAREGQCTVWASAHELAGYAMPAADKPLVVVGRDMLDRSG